MIQDGYLFVLDEQASSVQRIRLSDKEQASASFTVKEGFGAPSMRYLFDGNLMITEAQTTASDIPTDGSYGVCSYILDLAHVIVQNSHCKPHTIIVRYMC